MKILHRYILSQLLRNFALSLLALTALFLLFDFFDRIDQMVGAGASVGLILLYFVYKLPLTVGLMLPVSMLVATLFTFGILSKNSEFTAMRAAGIPISWLARPLIFTGFAASLFAFGLNEFVIPYASTRMKEVYNLDIKRKDKDGTYSQTNFWWRNKDDFYGVDMFDSRTSTLVNLSQFHVDENFKVERRTDAERVTYVDPILGWTMKKVTQNRFESGEKKSSQSVTDQLTLPISNKPREFYDVRADRNSMSYLQMKRFIKKQQESGLNVSEYYADLYEKLAFPFVNLLCTLVALPFALKPARSGSMASSIMAGLVIGYTYYAVHYFSIALGRAELWPALFAAWAANFLMLFVAIILNSGAESPA